MSYSVSVSLDVSDYGLLRALVAQVAKAAPLDKNAQGLITTYKVKQLFGDSDDLQLAAKYLLEQLPRRPQA